LAPADVLLAPISDATAPDGSSLQLASTGPWCRSFFLEVGIGLLRRPTQVEPGLESLEDHMRHQGQPVIVGAGPVGLGAALFLARQGQVARVVELRDEPSRQSKALAVNPRTLERFLRAFVFPRVVTLPFVRGLMVRTVFGLDHELPDFLPPARAGCGLETVRAGQTQRCS
jgi:hypothetical protein